MCDSTVNIVIYLGHASLVVKMFHRLGLNSTHCCTKYDHALQGSNCTSSGTAGSVRVPDRTEYGHDVATS